MALIRPHGGKAPRVHPTAFAVESSVVVGDVEIGERSSIWFGAIVRGDVNSVRVGARTNVQDLSVVHVTSRKHATTLGDDVTVGHRVVLHGCTVGDRCLVGIGAIVLDGAVIGPDAMVGAGSLVPPGMVVPPGTLALGAPAKVRRDLTPDEIAFLLTTAANYARYAEQYRQEGWAAR